MEKSLLRLQTYIKIEDYKHGNFYNCCKYFISSRNYNTCDASAREGFRYGAAFGGGSSNSVFGATGPAGFLGKLTYILVAVWMILVLSLAFILKSQNTEETFDIDIAPEENLIDEVQENEIPTS